MKTAVLVLVMVGCLPFLHPWATDRAIEGSYDQVFQATLETLEQRDFPIQSADREGGRIETGKRPVDAVGPYHPVETVRAEIEDEEEVSVRLFLTFQAPQPSSLDESQEPAERRVSRAAGQALNKSAIYDEYLDAIEERVRALRNGEET